MRNRDICSPWEIGALWMSICIFAACGNEMLGIWCGIGYCAHAIFRWIHPSVANNGGC